MSSCQSKNGQDSAVEAQKKNNVAVRVSAYRNEIYNDLEFYVYSVPGAKSEAMGNSEVQHVERSRNTPSANPMIRYPSKASLGFTDHFNGDEADERSISSESRTSTKSSSLISATMMSFASLRNLKPSTGNACNENSPRKVIRFPSERSIVPRDDAKSATGSNRRDIYLEQTVSRDNSYRSVNSRGNYQSRVYQNSALPSIPAMTHASHLDHKAIYRHDEPELVTYEPSLPLPPTRKRIVKSTSFKAKDAEANRVQHKKTPLANPSSIPDMNDDKSFVKSRKQSSRNKFFDRFKPRSPLSLPSKQNINKQDSNIADDLRMTFPHDNSHSDMMKSEHVKKSNPVELPKRLNKSSRDVTATNQVKSTNVHLNRSNSHRHHDVSNASTSGCKQPDSRLMSKVDDIVASYSNYYQPSHAKSLKNTSTPETSFTYPRSFSPSVAPAIFTASDSIATNSFENVHGHSMHRREHNERYLWQEKMEGRFVQPDVDGMERRYVQSDVEEGFKWKSFSAPLPLVVPTEDRSLISELSNEQEVVSSNIFHEVQETNIEVYPGVCLLFRGIDDTKLAIMNDSIVPNQCPICNETRFCITNVEYFLCHQCRVVSQNEHDNAKRHSMRNIKSFGGTVGLGFTFEHFMELQQEIKNKW